MHDADIRTVEVGTVDKEHQQMELIAKMAASVLTKHYPNHLWMVGWMPGMALVLKLGEAPDLRYGYSIDVPRCASVSELEKEIMRGGGELLERLNMPRGAWDGEFPTQGYDGQKEVT